MSMNNIIGSIRKYFLPSPREHEKVNDNYIAMTDLPFFNLNNMQLENVLQTIFEHPDKKQYILDKIKELEALQLPDEKADESWLSKIDPDLNMLCYANDTINSSSTYFDSSSFSRLFSKSINHLSILNANIRSISKNLDDMKILISNLNYSFPILGFTETWLKPYNLDIFNYTGYNQEHDIRPEQQGGGVSLFIANQLLYTRRNDIQFNPSFNHVIINIDKKELESHFDISVIVIYRPPNTDTSTFLDELENMLKILQKEKKIIFLLGDFNYNTFKATKYDINSVESESFSNLLSSYNLIKLIHKPTRIKPPSATLLDNIYTSTPINVDTCRSGIITSDISDHFFVFGMFSKLPVKSCKKWYKARNFCDKNIYHFNNHIGQVNWENMYSMTSFPVTFRYFINCYHTHFLESFPEKNY